MARAALATILAALALVFLASCEPCAVTIGSRCNDREQDDIEQGSRPGDGWQQ